MLRAKKRTGWNLSNAFAEELYVSTRGVDVIDPCPLEIPDILLSPPPDPENGRSPRPTIGRLAQNGSRFFLPLNARARLYSYEAVFSPRHQDCGS